MCKFWTGLFLGSLLLLSVGCATVAQMPLQARGPAQVLPESASILVAKLSIKNANQPGHQPVVHFVVLKKNDKLFSFTDPTLLSDLDKEGKTYFISMATEPGMTTLSGVAFLRQIPLLLTATAQLPFRQTFEVPANKIVYLGNITAVIVPKKNDADPPAGGAIPLIDQAVAGFSSGTFVVTIADNFNDDIAEVKAKFPNVANMEAVDMTLPAWKYPPEEPAKTTH